MDRKLVLAMLWVDIGILLLLAIDVYLSYQNMLLNGGQKVL